MATPEFRLYNTLTRRVEPFAPADGETVRLYTCGPTVYNPAHLGNFRTFLFEDLLRRTLRLRGWKVKQVMNLTDVDDKIIKRAQEQGKRISEITEPITEIFFRDLEYLRIEPAEVYPRATEHIPEMIALVQSLLEREIAYQAEDGSVYFAIARFPGYGKLSRLDTRSIRAGARVAADDYNKEDVRDFALWKAAKEEDEAAGAAWDSPWGRGRPGWHLECSAMARKHLGDTLDIHCGGVDLVFPHHEDEIAQSEGATGVEFSRVWCHGEFLLTEGAKMAKRVGNVTNVDGLREAGISTSAFRHFVFSTHYRKQLNLTEVALEASVSAVRRVDEFADRLYATRGGTAALAVAADELEQDATAALFDDLNAPEAMGALFTFIRKANAELDAGGKGDGELERARNAFGAINKVLEIAPIKRLPGEVSMSPQELIADEETAFDRGVRDWAEERVAARRAARERRDFATSDAIRKELESRGIEIKDTASGTQWKKVR
ncbi:MAG: cysteine--tRNA ligase [Anaerolineae bacterium]|nr:cysteine--tRNA ligase [Gemmatimonadaceae bacterium]